MFISERKVNAKINASTTDTPDLAEHERELLLREGRKIVEALGEMFAPHCEAVLHDLTKPDASIVAVACPISGRDVGDSCTELGLARIADRDFPDVVQNYTNRFPDGRPAKSTSIGLRDSSGDCVAAICLNMDISMFVQMQQLLTRLTSSTPPPQLARETLRHRSLEDIQGVIDAHAAKLGASPRALTSPQRKEVIRRLHALGLLQLRNAAPMVAEILGVARTSVYYALKE